MAKLPFWLKSESMKTSRDGVVWTIRIPWYGWPVVLWKILKKTLIDIKVTVWVGGKN